MSAKVFGEPLANIFVTAGQMGERIRQYDWAGTRLGEITQWPQSLRSALSICLNSNFPIAIYWGPDLVLLYNDAWSPIPGNKHPWALGKPAVDVWPEIWGDIEPQFKKAFTGVPGGSRDALLPMQRHGYTEECYFDFTFTPIYGESGKVEGIFNAVIETTYRVINERRSGVLQKLSDSVNAVTTYEEVFARAGEVLNRAKEDVPFYFIIKLEGERHQVVAASSDDPSAFVTDWPMDDVRRGSVAHVQSIDQILSRVPRGSWPERPTEAVVIPLKASDGRVIGCIAGGLSARRQYDKEYKAFYESIATIISGELNTINSLNQERKRAEALAEIDKAKTIFFSNISHEFRTPLTLMLGPLETIMSDADTLSEEQRENLSVSYRNTLRLQKLVNTLLDFSRIEAGKMEARFAEVEIGAFTADLASSFRSAIENAGLEFKVSVDRTLRASIDTDMWEKIVLNLISNAFKYTERGSIEVKMSRENGTIRLSVSDTGVGIREEDVDKIFDRFYRVNNESGRSQEGSGIGLSLVRELVSLHKGEIRVQSQLGSGSTFVVTIPCESGATVQPSQKSSQDGQGTVRQAFLEEINKWGKTFDQTGASKTATENKPRVLIADDNADMRDYILRILRSDFYVRIAANGEEAFELALNWSPEIVVTDIMMPKLDGFGLLRKMRSSLATRGIPVIFLSARAGEEARVEGITAGADDYLVKPFSAKELYARVHNHIITGRTRRHTEKEFYNLFLQCPAHIHVMKGPDHLVEFFHPLGKKFVGGRDLTGLRMKEALPEVAGQGFFEMLDQVYYEGKSFFLREAKATLSGESGKPDDYYFDITYRPLKDLEGKIEGVLQFSLDVTDQAKINKKIRESEELFRLLVTSIPQIIWIADNTGKIEYLSEQWEKYTGVTTEEGIQRFSSYIHEQDIDTVRARWTESMATGNAWKSEFRLKDARTGQYRWFSGHTLPITDSEGKVIRWIGSSADIQSQKTANEELEGLVSERTSELIELNKILKAKNEELSRAQLFLQTVLDSSIELVTAFDVDLNFTFVNRRAREVGDWEQEHLIGRNILDVDRGIEKTDIYSYLKRALNGETVYIASRKPHVKANLIFETFVVPLKSRDKIIGVVTMNRDITAMSQLAENLREANVELKRSNEDLQQFAHVTSHDLKEPVRKIRMYGNMLTTEYASYIPEKGIGYLGKIEKAASRIAAMIDGVLQYSSINQRDQQEDLIDLNDMIRNIVEDLEIPVRETNASIKADNLPSILGSPTLIYQLFYNLLNNSLKFRRNGVAPVISITSAGAPGKDIGHGPRDYLLVTVEDNGIGFEQEYADKIFESFSRLNPKDRFEGTGLGLALCKKIVLRHRGTIEAEGSLGKGAKFLIYFPKGKEA